MKYLNIIPIIFFAFALSGCQSWVALQDDLSEISQANLHTAEIVNGEAEILLANPCPKVELVDDLSSLSDFSDPKKQVKENLISRVDLRSAESTCKLSSKSAVVDLKLIFNGTLGKKGRKKSSDKPFFSYPFFVAVTAPNGKIMAKEIFAASITYNANENKHTYFEKLRQIIPIKSKDMARHYKVLIGFQVTPDQLAYNRKHMVSIADVKAAGKKDTREKDDNAADASKP